MGSLKPTSREITASLTLPRPTKKLSVLVVDDFQDAAESLVSLLVLQGHDARAVGSGECALQATTIQSYDAIIFELRLPGIDGWELARRLTTLPGTKKPFTIALTTRGTASDIQKSENAGIYLHLVKPADPTRLLRVIERFWQVLCPRSSGCTTDPSVS